jgi:hypothetical protein
VESAFCYVKCLAPVSYAVVLLFLLLLPTGVLISLRAKSWKPIVVFLLVAWLPTLLGLFGTIKIYENVTFAAEHIGGLSESHVEGTKALARVNTYMGLAATLPLLLVGTIGAVAKGRRMEDRRLKIDD